MADDITIPIGAKDMATEVLEGVEQSTRELTRAVSQMANKTAKSTQKMEIGFKDLAVAASVIGGVIKGAELALSGLGSVFGGLSGSIDAFEQQEEALRGLKKQLELVGESARFDSLKELSAELQNVVGVGDEVTLGLIKNASAWGVQGDQLEDVTKAAIGLSEATGASLEDSLRKVNETLNGNTEAFAEFLPQLRTMASDEEKLAAVMKVANDGLAQRVDSSSTLAGSNERLTNSWQSMTESVGALFAPVRQLWNEGFARMADAISSSLQPAIEAVNRNMESMRPVIDVSMNAFNALGDVIGVTVNTIVNAWAGFTAGFRGNGAIVEATSQSITETIQSFRDTAVAAITYVGLAFERAPGVVSFVKDRIALNLVTIAEDIKHAFTVRAPAYLEWFAENFTNLLSDAFNGATTIAFNAGQKIGRVTKAIANAVKTAFTGDFVGDLKKAMEGDLLEGFKAQTSAMPEIAKRAMTETEKVLKDRSDNFQVGFTEEFLKRISARTKDIAAEANKVAGNVPTVDLNLDSSGAVDSLATLWDGVSGQATQFLGDFWEGLTGSIEAPEASQGNQSLQAQESRLLAGRSRNNEQVMVMREAVAETKRSNTLLERIADGVTGGGLQVEYVG
ncbi:MAG: hypothetical protein AAFU85_02130 [Planctomycetota bacterium]